MPHQCTWIRGGTGVTPSSFIPPKLKSIHVLCRELHHRKKGRKTDSNDERHSALQAKENEPQSDSTFALIIFPHLAG